MMQTLGVFVVAPDGRPLAFSPATGADGSSNLDLRYADRPVFQEAVRTQGPAVSGIVFGRATRDFIVGAAAPIRIDQRIAAYLLGSIRLQASIEAIEQAAAGPGGWLVPIAGDRQASVLQPPARPGPLAH